MIRLSIKDCNKTVSVENKGLNIYNIMTMTCDPLPQKYKLINFSIIFATNEKRGPLYPQIKLDFGNSIPLFLLTCKAWYFKHLMSPSVCLLDQWLCHHLQAYSILKPFYHKYLTKLFTRLPCTNIIFTRTMESCIIIDRSTWTLCLCFSFSYHFDTHKE